MIIINGVVLFNVSLQPLLHVRETFAGFQHPRLHSSHRWEQQVLPQPRVASGGTCTGLRTTCCSLRWVRGGLAPPRHTEQ